MKAREPKTGDRCERAQYNPATYRKNYDCQVLHLQGKPPGQLVVRRDQGQSVLVCSKHAEGMELVSVRKQKPRKADASSVQIDFEPIGVAEIHPNHSAKNIKELFSMPEGE